MHLVSNKKRKFIGRIIASLFIFATLLAPFNTTFEISTVEAKWCTRTGLPNYEIPDNESCSTGISEAPGPTPSGDPGSQFGHFLAQIVYVFTVGLGSVVAALAAVFLNYTVSLSLDSAAYGLDFVSGGWTMMRDIANMAFIFILIYIAMKVMFEAHTAGTMGMLAKVLAVALVINFSFFATRVVIDAGNLISVQFYNAIVQDSTTVIDPNIAIAGGIQTPVPVPDLTKKIMGGVNIVSGLNSSSFSQTIGKGSNPLDFAGNFVTALITFSFIYIVLGAALFMLAAAFVAAGVKFIVRIVMLWVTIITAPLALVAWSFQGGGGHSGGHGGGGYFKKWRDNLISHAFYPAVFLFVLLLISQFMSAQEGAGGLGGGLIKESLEQGGLGIIATLANILVRLGFVIAMLYFALKASDYFEVVGGSVAKAWGNTAAFSWPAGLMRFGVGGGSRFLADKIKGEGFGSKVVKAPLNLLAKRSFDTRSLPSKLPGAKDILEKDFGKITGKGGWDEFIHHKAAEDKKKADAIAQRVTGHTDPKAEQKAQKQFRKEYGATAFDAKVEQLAHTVEKFRKEEVELQKNILKATDEAAREKYQSDLKTKQNDIKNTEKQLKALKGMGQRIIEAQQKPHAQEVAIKLMSSNNVVKYMAGKKILMGKSSTEKFKEAAKEAAKEDGEEDEKPAGGGTTPAGGGSGGAGPTHPPGTHT